jgi:chromosome segregation ATPase
MSGVVHAQTPMTPISSSTPLTPLSSDGSRNTAVFGGPLNKIQPSHEDEKEDMHIFKSPQAIEPEPAPAAPPATAPPAPPAPKSPTSPSDKLQQQIIDLRTQLADEKRDSQQILSVKNSAIESFQSTIEKLEEDLANAQKESSTRKEDGDAKTAALEAEKAELQEELDDRNQRLFQVQNASALEDTITKLQTELDELRVTNEDTNSKLTQTQQDLKEESYKDGQLAQEQLDEHIDSLMARLKKAEQSASEASIAAREDKDGKLKQLNEQIEALQTQVSELQAQVDTAQSESAAATVRMGTNAVEIDHLCQRIESLEDENEKLKGDLENKTDRVSQIEDEHTQLKKELNEARDQAKAKEEENGNLKKAEESNKSATSVQRDGALKNVTELKQELDQLDDEHCSLLEKQSQQQQQHAAQGDPSFYWKMATGILGAATILGGTWIYQANNQ